MNAQADEHPTGKVSVRCTFKGCRYVETVPLAAHSTVADGLRAGGDARLAHYRARHLASEQALYDATVLPLRVGREVAA